MRPILSDKLTFRQHKETLFSAPEKYKPDHCPYCYCINLWSHGCYYRKPDSLKDISTESDDTSSIKKGSSSHYLWAILIARIYAIFPLICPDCGGQMKIIAFIREKPIIHKILNTIGEPTKPPVLYPPRAPFISKISSFIHLFSLVFGKHPDNVP